MDMTSSDWFSHAEMLSQTGMCMKRNSGQSPTMPQPSMLGKPRKYYYYCLWVVKIIYISLLSLRFDDSGLQTSVKCGYFVALYSLPVTLPVTYLFFTFSLYLCYKCYILCYIIAVQNVAVGVQKPVHSPWIFPD